MNYEVPAQIFVESQQKTCVHCQGSKRVQACVLCSQMSCKNCHFFVNSEEFSFYSKNPLKGIEGWVCTQCYGQKVEPEKIKYQSLFEQAQGIYFLTKNYRGNLRLKNTYTKRVSVDSCQDRREAITRLAFYAAELNYNAIIQAEIVDKKIKRPGGYQSTEWSASALPANIDGIHLEKATLRGF
jgi:hypothetical protein